MRRLLLFACRAFPPEHRARRSDEVVDTALLAAAGSAWGTAREALSLVVAGIWQRLRAESGRSLRDGAALLAGVLAVVNLAVALAGVAMGVHPPGPATFLGFGLGVVHPYVVDWWWIAFTVAAAGVVLGLVLGNRRLALGAGILNLGIIGYDALFVANGTDWFSGHLAAFAFWQFSAFPDGRDDWLAPAIVLVLATAAAPFRGSALRRLPLALVAALLLVVLSREISGAFLFLLWPLTAVAVLATAFSGLAPRLAVLAVGGVLAAAPSVVPNIDHDPRVTWGVAAGLAVGLVVRVAQLARRRLA
jgi:hypothetical protein